MSLSLYKDAGSIVDSVRTRRQGLKAALYHQTERKGFPAGKIQALKALVCKTLGVADAFEAVLKKGASPKVDGMLLCLAHDMAETGADGGKKLRKFGGGVLTKAIKPCLPALRTALAEDKQHTKEKEDSCRFAYFRVNPRLVAARADPEPVSPPPMRPAFGEEGRTPLLQRLDALVHRVFDISVFLKEALDVGGTTDELKKVLKCVEKDALVPLCYKLPAKHLKTLLPLTKRGDLIVQDRSSQFSAHAAISAAFGEDSSEVGGSSMQPASSKITFVDACAAPGSKTIHLLHLLQLLRIFDIVPTSKVFEVVATERDQKRFAILERRIRELCCGGGGGAGDTEGKQTTFEQQYGIQISLFRTDFLDKSEEGLQKKLCAADVLILDPSCSGSGLAEHSGVPAGDVGSSGTPLVPEVDKDRVTKLADFQLRMVEHAMGLLSSAPIAEKTAGAFEQRVLLYSTCSIYDEENEGVAWRALGSGVAQKAGWRLSSEVLPYAWPEQAKLGVKPSADGAPSLHAKCVHSLPWEHECRGFFLAKFELEGRNRVPKTVLDESADWGVILAAGEEMEKRRGRWENGGRLSGEGDGSRRGSGEGDGRMEVDSVATDHDVVQQESRAPAGVGGKKKRRRKKKATGVIKNGGK